MAKARQQYFADETSIQKDAREFAIEEQIKEKIDSIEEGAQVNVIETVKVNGEALTPDEDKAVDIDVPLVDDTLYSTSSEDALSARQGRILYDYIQNLQSRGRYLSNWNCVTGLATTNPADNPYNYRAGDYYLVSNIAAQGGTNYRPNGTQYIIGQASTTIESEVVGIGDMYIYDGTTWLLLSNSSREITVDSSLSTTSTNPVENRVITQALNGKQNTISDLQTIREGAALGATSLQPGDSLSELTGTSDDIAEGTSHLFMTPQERTKLGNQSGVNTGDETKQTIEGKLLVASASNNGYLSSTDWSTFNGKQDAISDLTTIRSNASAGKSASDTIATYGDIVTHNVNEFATATQGGKADTAIQPGDNVSELTNDAGYITDAYHDNTKQDKLVAGANIQIAVDGKTISATDTTYQASDFDIKDLADTTGLRTTWSGKQDTLIAGTNIQIAADGKTISATDTTYTAGPGISISNNNVISNTQTSAEWGNITGTLSNQTDLQSALDDKQDTLIAGANIQIAQDGKTISSTDTTYVAGDFDIKDLADSTGLRTTWSGKQDALIAGINIQIAQDGKTISSTDTTYSAGTNITIDANNQISATDTTYTAGTGINIDANNGISNTGVLSVNGQTGNVTITIPDDSNVKVFKFPSGTPELPNSGWVVDQDTIDILNDMVNYLKDNEGDIPILSYEGVVNNPLYCTHFYYDDSNNQGDFILYSLPNSAPNDLGRAYGIGYDISGATGHYQFSLSSQSFKNYTIVSGGGIIDNQAQLSVDTSIISTKQYVDDKTPIISATQPTGTEGMIWYDTTNDVLKTYNGTSWETAGTQMVVLSYGHSTWQEFLDAYEKNAIVYCRASSQSNPGSGNQTRMAFMAFVDKNATTGVIQGVEFQYYRSRSDHNSAANQLDEVYVYKLTSNGTWTVTQRNTGAKAVAGTGINLAFGSGNMTISNTGVTSFNGDTGAITLTPGTYLSLNNNVIDVDTSLIATKADLANFAGFLVVAQLPTTDIKTNIIYLLGPVGTGADKYEEYIYSNNTWIKIGDTSIDLSPYFHKTNDDSDDIIEGSTHLFLTSAERTKLGNTSGTNSGDETKTTIQTKLGAASSSNSGYLTSTDWDIFNNKVEFNATNGGVKIFDMPSVNGSMDSIIQWFTAGGDIILREITSGVEYYYFISNWDGTNRTMNVKNITGTTITSKTISYTSAGICSNIITSTQAIGSNTKTFTISGASDLTTAAEIIDWIEDGNMAIILYNDDVYCYHKKSTSGYTSYDFFSVKDYEDSGWVVKKYIELQDFGGGSYYIYIDTYNEYQLPSGGGHSTITVTLTSAGWSNNEQTVTATGVTASNTVIVSPAPANIDDYAESKVYGYTQGTNSLTFKCSDTPTGDISVNVLIMN